MCELCGKNLAKYLIVLRALQNTIYWYRGKPTYGEEIQTKEVCGECLSLHGFTLEKEQLIIAKEGDGVEFPLGE